MLNSLKGYGKNLRKYKIMWIWRYKSNKMSDKIIKKNQFQIRKVPLKRFAP